MCCTGELLQNNAADDQDDSEDERGPADDVQGPGHCEFEHYQNHEDVALDEGGVEWFAETDSGDSDVDTAEPENGLSDSKRHLGGTRIPAVEGQMEYIKLKELGLHIRPQGCYLGIHLAAQVWRAASAHSAHFSRSWGKHRTSWQQSGMRMRCLTLHYLLYCTVLYRIVYEIIAQECS